MKFKAKSTFTVFHEDAMHVFNAGSEGELPDAVAAPYVASGLAKELKGKGRKAAKADGEPETAAEPAAPAAAVADDDAPPA